MVVGSRGMGAIKRSLFSFVGLGSVSDYLLHHLDTPVMVRRARPTPPLLPTPLRARPPHALLASCHAAGARALSGAAHPRPLPPAAAPR